MLGAASMKSALTQIESYGGGLEAFSRGYEYYGFNRVDDGERKGISYREWLPSASRATLVGDFNGWNRDAHPMTKDEYVCIMVMFSLVRACFRALCYFLLVSRPPPASAIALNLKPRRKRCVLARSLC
jgi:hypothetical protein